MRPIVKEFRGHKCPKYRVLRVNPNLTSLSWVIMMREGKKELTPTGASQCSAKKKTRPH